MGTRHLIFVVSGGEYRIAQYGQWDGYPSGQGTTVLDFLRTSDLLAFKSKCEATKWLHEEAAQGMSDEDQEKLFKANPQWSRDNGAKILGIVLNAPEGIVLRNSISFANDSLMCEWAYVIDLDLGVLEVYKGFNVFNPVGRFVSDKKDAQGYYPVTLVKSYLLDALPNDEEFVKELDSPEDE